MDAAFGVGFAAGVDFFAVDAVDDDAATAPLTLASVAVEGFAFEAEGEAGAFETGFCIAGGAGLGFASTGFAGCAFAFTGLFASAFLLAEAAVGRVMRSRKLPSTTGARLLLVDDAAESRDGGRWLVGSDVRGLDFAAAGCDFGRDAVDDLNVDEVKDDEGAALSGSCFAFEEAVGAVRWDERACGLVTSRGLSLEVGGEVLLLVDFSAAAASERAIDAAVGAVRELRGGLEIDALPESGVFG